MAMAHQLLQVRSAAQELGVHENTLRRWEQAGFIDAVRLPSGVRRFRLEDVEELRQQMYGATKGHGRALEALASRDQSRASRKSKA